MGVGVRALALVLPALLPSGSRADEPRQPLIAVLEFASKLDAQAREEADPQYFSDVVRGQALDELPASRLMTRENMTVLLQAAGKDLAACEGECEVDTGRKLGADYVVSGGLLKVGSSFKLDLKLHATADGRLLAGAVASGKSVDELDAALPAVVKKLLAPLGVPVIANQPAPRAGAPATSPQQRQARPPQQTQQQPPQPAVQLPAPESFQHIKVGKDRILHQEHFFETGQSTVSRAAGPLVREAAAVIVGPPARAVEVVCRGERGGGAAKNLRAAKQKALALRHALVEAGAPAARVKAMWLNPERQAAEAGHPLKVLHLCELLLR